jgi:hypothetical protein
MESFSATLDLISLTDLFKVVLFLSVGRTPHPTGHFNPQNPELYHNVPEMIPEFIVPDLKDFPVSRLCGNSDGEGWSCQIALANPYYLAKMFSVWLFSF